MPLAVPRVVDAWHFAWLNSDLRRVKRNHPEKVPASLEDPQNNNKTHGFFSPGNSNRYFFPGFFPLLIREVLGACRSWIQLGAVFLFHLRGQGLHVPTLATLLTCQKKSRERQPQVGHVQHYLEKEGFC